MKFIVYKTTCLVNGKIYIGVHQTEDPNIFDGYIGDGIATYFTYYIKNPKWAFHHAVAKYGIENFKRETLFIFDSEKEAYQKEEELVDLNFINRKDTYNVALGGEYIKKISAPIYQFDLNGNFIKQFESAYAAQEATGICDTTIRTSAREKIARCGYLWSWNKKVKLEEYYIKSFKKYYIYDSNGIFIKEFDKASDCLSFLETNIHDRGVLSRATKGLYKINGYFVTCEKLDHISVQITRNNAKLNRYTLNGEYIDSFNSAKEAKEKLNLKLSSLSSAIRTGRSCNGYRWTRNNNPPMKIT